MTLPNAPTDTGLPVFPALDFPALGFTAQTNHVRPRLFWHSNALPHHPSRGLEPPFSLQATRNPLSLSLVPCTPGLPATHLSWGCSLRACRARVSFGQPGEGLRENGTGSSLPQSHPGGEGGFLELTLNLPVWEWGGERGREEFIVFLLLFNHKLWLMSGTFPLKASNCSVFYLKTSKRLRMCFRWDAAEGVLTQ